MLVLASLLAVASIGQTLVVIIGGIDLSIPFVIGFANVVAAQLYGDGMNFVAGLRRGRRARASASARSTARSPRGFDIHPLIVTLGIGTIVQGAVLLWTERLPFRLGAAGACRQFVSIGGSSARCRCRGWCRASSC